MMFTKKFSFLLLAFCHVSFAAPIEFNQFDNPQQEADYQSLIQTLRCPQCQNNNIADSNATIATDMRGKTLELLKQGKNKEEVVEYMIERYGNFVTYDPPMTPATIFLWVLPLLLILTGLGLILRRRKAPQAVENTEKFAKSALDQARLDEILNKDKK